MIKCIYLFSHYLYQGDICIWFKNKEFFELWGEKNKKPKQANKQKTQQSLLCHKTLVISYFPKRDNYSHLLLADFWLSPLYILSKCFYCYLIFQFLALYLLTSHYEKCNLAPCHTVILPAPPNHLFDAVIDRY